MSDPDRNKQSLINESVDGRAAHAKQFADGSNIEQRLQFCDPLWLRDCLSRVHRFAIRLARVREFSSFKVSGFFELQPENLERSPAWRATIDRLIELANADHPRAGGRLVRLSLEEVEQLARAGWEPSRPRAWNENKRRGSDPELGNAHAQAYLRALRRAGERFLGTASTAAWIHRDCVQRVRIGSGLRQNQVPPSPALSPPASTPFSAGQPARPPRASGPGIRTGATTCAATTPKASAFTRTSENSQ
jgi:hypothetical protein